MARDMRGKNLGKVQVRRNFCNKSNGLKQCNCEAAGPFRLRYHSETLWLGRPLPLPLPPPINSGERSEARLRFNPPHDWFHAVDPMSYTHEDSRHSRGHPKEQLRCDDVDMGEDGGDAQSSLPDLDLPLHLCKDPNCEYYRYEYQVCCPYKEAPVPGGQLFIGCTKNPAMLDALDFPVEDGDEEEENDDNELSRIMGLSIGV
ncbi:hypothetical protein V8F06_010967 [Rhypophila decipiens]